jgi:hypothetical protein
LSEDTLFQYAYDLNDQAFKNAIENLANQSEEYFRTTIREIWHLPFLKKIATKFLYIETSTPSTAICHKKEGKYFFIEPFKVKCKPEVFSKIFLRA